uniref:Uncharacterized protein n=1 Tax=Oryza punctata TaxID=4537 RepID=A0A0E0K9Z0_ORYPU
MARSSEGGAGSAASSPGWAATVAPPTAAVLRLSAPERGRRPGGSPAATIIARPPASSSGGEGMPSRRKPGNKAFQHIGSKTLHRLSRNGNHCIGKPSSSGRRWRRVARPRFGREYRPPGARQAIANKNATT